MAATSGSFRRWFAGNWTTPTILLGIFLLALYLRSYYPWSLAWPGGLLSGGSDSYYHRRIIESILQTGHQLTFDPLLNFPMGLVNPRPPFYQWTTVLTGIVVAPFFGGVWQGVTFTFMIGTAVWGALTVFPLYFLTKEAFGKRAALLAAFFLAVLPAHLQRSPATDADHDAIVLFFVVAAFFFFLKSLRLLNERRWVEDWAFWRKDGRTSLLAGVQSFFVENRTSVLYAMLAGWSIAAIALIWQGWAYATTILGVYFAFQIIVHRFRNQDPMGIVIAYGIAVGLPLLVAFPWYWLNGQVKVWYDVPFYLFLLSVAVGIVFAATRDYPWALVVPGVIGAGAIALVIIAIFYPAIGVVFVSGAGYFVRTKAYETIAEAQAPGFSQIILSFGVATYFMALFGILWLAYGITKRRSPDYLFVVVWIVAAIFMAESAARFIFNASPAFAIASAYVTVLLLKWLRFDEMQKTYRSLGGSRIAAFRRSVKVRHVFGAGLVILVLLPNVWFGVDASIPFEEKSRYDKQVYDAFPSFLKPPGYSTVTSGGGSFFFGAFGYSLPLEKEYFPAAWSWFAKQDADVTPDERKPAFLSWWDYGFEASNAGRHPTVADNFLDGYQLAGQFITAPGEEEAIALLDLRLLQGDWLANGRRFSDGVRATLTGLNVPYASLEDAFNHPEKYVDIVNADPVKYGDWQTLQAINAQFIYGRVLLTDTLDGAGLAQLNHALRRAVGGSIRYFAVDTRLFPLDGQNTGIFYAPVKLSDHRVLDLADGRSIPIDFFDISASTQRGVVNVADLLPTDQVTSVQIHYKDAFYNSMFYRAYAGFSPTVAGQSCDDCIPGLQSQTNQQIQNIAPMPAWNLRHFRLVYKTAYYNPYPPQEVANHTDAWTALDYAEAQVLQQQINSGDAVGVVDLSPAAAMRRGIVFIKYYDGAFLNGTVTLGGSPWPGVHVTATDEFGVPHDAVVTDATGRYSLLLPFGTIRVEASIGRPDNRTLVAPTVVNDFIRFVSDAAAMRENVDMDGVGGPDWLLTHDIAVAGDSLDGTAYVDADGDGARQAGETVLDGADVTLRRAEVTLTRTGRTDAAGHVRIDGLYVGTYNATIDWRGRSLKVLNVTIARNQIPKDLAVTPVSLQGYVLDSTGREVGDSSVAVTDLENGTVFRATTADDGFFAFTVLPGDFDFVASEGTLHSVPDRATVAAGTGPAWHNVTVFASGTVDVRSTLGGAPVGFVTLEFTPRSASRSTRLVTTDGRGDAVVILPAGAWDVHARHHMGSTIYAFVGGLVVSPGDTASFTASLVQGAAVSGTVFNQDNVTETVGAGTLVFRGDPGQVRLMTGQQGQFLTYLPFGTWAAQVNARDFTAFRTYAIAAADTRLSIPARHGSFVTGSVFRSFGENQTVQIEDPVSDALVRFANATQSYQAFTGGDGAFSVALPPEGQFALHLARDGYLPYDAPAAFPSQWQEVRTFSLVAQNVTVQGALTLNGAAFTDATLPVQFRAEGPGATSAFATLDGNGGYSATLSPGRYEVVVDRDETGANTTRLQLRDPTHVTLDVGGRPPAFDLPLVVRVKVTGSVTLAGEPRSPVVAFDGPDVTTVNATNGAFSTFLATGTYTVSANVTEGARTYLAFEPVAALTPATVDLDLRLATNVTGSAFDAGLPVTGLPITFALQGGGTVRAATDSSGSYNALLLGGTYDVSADLVANATEGGATRTVRHTFSGTLTVVQGTPVQRFDLDLSRALENTTLTGSVRYLGAGVPAQIALTARGTAGINATAASGSDGTFIVAVQPGTYDVYALDSLNAAAFVGSVTVTREARSLNVPLEAAFRATGVTLYRGNLRVAANLTFTSAAGSVGLRSNANGDFTVWLPAATYSVDATTAGTERGIPITYRATASLALTANDVVRLPPLTKVVQRAVQVTWDPLQVQIVKGGGSVEYQVVVANEGNEDDTYAMSATGEGFSYSFRPEKVTLPFGSPGNTATVTVEITAALDAKVEHAPISIVARSQADASISGTVIVNLTVEPKRGLTARVSSDAPVWDGQYLNYTLEIQNTGNGAATYRLTLPNLDELAAAGWRAAFVVPGVTPASEIDLAVAANTTSRPMLRFQSVGGVPGTLASVQVEDAAAALSSLFTVSVQMPILASEGGLRAGGSGITVAAPGLDVATVAFLVSLVAFVAAVAYLAILRRRSR